MKIGIVTFYNSPNYGSLLQANALKILLSKYGEVFFIKIKIRNIWKKLLRRIVKRIITFRFRKCLFECNKLLSCYENIKKFNLIKIDEKSLKNIDLIIFGSDELWNIKRKECQHLLLWGKGFENHRKISYAVSINNSMENDLYENNSPHEYLKTFDKIGVRDKHSQTVIQNVTERDVSLLLDPTFLLEPKDIMPLRPRKKISNYIAVYSYAHQLNKDTAKMLQNIAKSLGKELISLLDYLNWCNRNMAVANPFAYYENADFVISSTFHGTALAINFKKQFIVFFNNNIKINELLGEFNLSDRIADGLPENELVNLINLKIDYTVVEKVLNEKKLKSLDYLSSALKLGE